MLYSKNKQNINKANIKKQYLYDLPSKRASALSSRESNNYSKISDIYKYIYEDYFPSILIYKTKELFQNEIDKKSLNFLKNNFTEQELNSPFIKITIKKIQEELSIKINKDYTFLKESLNNIKKFPKKITYLRHFRKHCNKTEDIAKHLCDNG